MNNWIAEHVSWLVPLIGAAVAWLAGVGWKMDARIRRLEHESRAAQVTRDKVATTLEKLAEQQTKMLIAIERLSVRVEPNSKENRNA